jgi:hypothetical protein
MVMPDEAVLYGEYRNMKACFVGILISGVIDRQVVISRLPVGHTHEDIDQKFSVISRVGVGDLVACCILCRIVLTTGPLCASSDSERGLR